MPPRLSLHLDLLRVIAALSVLISHAMHPHFGPLAFDPLDYFDYGADAVILFFVVSGFVIAYAAERDGSGQRFVFNRATRLISVAFPAIALTLVLDAIGRPLAPEMYQAWQREAPSALQSILLGATFSNEWSWGGVHVGTNHPLWSLSYEAAYYLMFAAATFLSGVRRIAALALCIIVAGVNVMLLAPAWLAGVAAYRIVKSAKAGSSLVWGGVALATAVIYFVLNRDEVDHLLLVATAAIVDEHPLVLFRYSGQFLWSWLIALLFALHIIAIGRAFPGGDRPESGGARLTRWLSGASFSIYAAHYPVLMFAAAISPFALDGLARVAALSIVGVAACLVFASAFERPLTAFRRAARRVFGDRADQ